MKINSYVLCLFLTSQKLFAGPVGASTRLKTYYSPWSQTYKTTQTGDPVAPEKIDIDNKSFNFTCPGGSFLTGIGTYYENNVRRFQFACTFFENAQGKLMTKTISKCNSQNWDNAPQSAGKSTCTATQFIGGMNGLFHGVPVGTGYSQVDQQYKGICCQLESPDNVNLVVDTAGCSGYVQLTSAVGQNTPMTMCTNNTIIQQIDSKFMLSGSNGDRLISFKCCPVKLQ